MSAPMTTATENSPPRVSTCRVLVIDDHAPARESMADILRHAGHVVEAAASAAEGLKAVSRQPFDVILTDLQMPGMSGLELVAELSRRGETAAIALITAHGTINGAVEAMRHGAFDFVEKPFTVDQLESLVARALSHVRSKRIAEASDAAPEMIGSSPAMRTLRQRIVQIAQTNETALITGESGVGKELVARAIHQASRRKDGPLVCVNCPALSPQLMESELFGHSRGAFTSADASRIGRFEAAHGGTLLLDEVTEIDLPLQAKLLRVLQERSFERVGESQTQRVDVRVLAATNRELREEVRQGRFREDLYFRLAVVPLAIPPLRERREDLPELINHFLERAAERLGQAPPTLSPEALEVLHDYAWPGNVRELENLMTRACVLGGKTVRAEEVRPWLMGAMAKPAASESLLTKAPDASLQDMERRMIEATLERFAGHRGKTAEALGIGVRTLANKLRSYGYGPREKSFARAA